MSGAPHMPGRIDLVYGDCLDALRAMPAASHHALVTDPPFTSAGGSSNGRSGGAVADSQFFLSWLRQVFAECQRVLVPDGCGFVFCDWRTAGLLDQAFGSDGTRITAETWRVSQVIVWDRDGMGLGSPFRNSFEMIAFARGPKYRSGLPKDIKNIIRHRWPYGRHPHHGAEKPVDLVRELIGYAEVPAGGRILDPFAGSGTTLLAAAGLGHAATGVELELSAYDAAVGRLADAGIAIHPSPRAREARLMAGRCPECGAGVEWRLHSSHPGDRAAAHCAFSSRAYRSDDSSRRCEWSGWAVRVKGGSARLQDVAP